MEDVELALSSGNVQSWKVIKGYANLGYPLYAEIEGFWPIEIEGFIK